jgi:transglutaminase-like putative cysteine protease
MLNKSALTLGNITWLLAAMAFVIAPHAARLPIWVALVCIAAGSWRWWIARRALRVPPWWMMGLIALAVALGARMEYGRWFGREVGVALLIIMLCLKILEMRMKRDAMIPIFMGFFLAMTNFMYSQTILMGLYMFICVWIFIAALIGFNRINTEATLQQRLVPAGWLLLQAIPMMLVLFFLFPRLSGALWSMPQDESSRTGLSDTMSPGDISKLSVSEAVAFRVEFEGAVPQNEDLYWRGPVLGEQDGRAWRMYPVAARARLNYVPQGPPIRYTVTLQPHNKSWLFALDLPAATPEDAFFTGDFQLRSRSPVTSLKAYAISSHLRYTIGTELNSSELQPYVSFDARLNPRAIAYGKQLRQDIPDPKALVESLLARYNKEFDYTLEPPRLGANPVDEFFFDTKKGFCEHYAGSFVLLLRAAGIPARVVTGYQGGEINPITRQLVVRQAEAHAWSEVWFADLGWVRVDPTFAVSPLRINRGMSEVFGPIGVMNNLIDADKLGVLRQIAYSWDAMNTQWNRWVVGFNQDKQRDLLEGFGMRDVDWRSIAIWLIVGVLSTGGVAGIFLYVRALQRHKDPIVAAYERLCRKLAKTGIERAAHEGPVDYWRRLQQARPQIAEAAAPLFERYVTLRYAESTGGSSQVVRDFAWRVWRFSF